MGLILLFKPGVLPNSFFFTKVTVDEITKMLEDLQGSKSTGLDGIPRCCRYYNCYVYCESVFGKGYNPMAM